MVISPAGPVYVPTQGPVNRVAGHQPSSEPQLFMSLLDQHPHRIQLVNGRTTASVGNPKLKASHAILGF